MPTKTDCPICGLTKIPGDADRCPQCDSDLSCFRVLDTLLEPEGETMAHTAPPTKSGVTQIAAEWCLSFRVVFVLLGVLVVALLGHQIYRINGLASQVSSQRSEFNDTAGTIGVRLDEISRRQDKILAEVTVKIESVYNELHRKPKPADTITADQQKESARGPKDSFEFYQALETDTLWGIAKQFYGSGFYYPVLLTHNPNLAIYRIGKKDRIAILKDVGRVKQIYNEITDNESGRLYWYYTIRPGDTPASVRYKYCPRHNCLQTETGFDSNAVLNHGKTIKIQLAGALK